MKRNSFPIGLLANLFRLSLRTPNFLRPAGPKHASPEHSCYGRVTGPTARSHWSQDNSDLFNC